jgi:hypothetical protein
MSDNGSETDSLIFYSECDKLEDASEEISCKQEFDIKSDGECKIYKVINQQTM